ncbi:hypothetical protein [Flavobacterium sp. UBA7680]|uniref:hypothetical protein n=1 Tax=Flavobacterium sp. UBA7680 TaxID=1946559 RepID=UPI0025BA02CC|nr:hypothetical protein [Flavobacterium sp. UBA7680]
MNLNDFIENANELGVVTLEQNQLKEVNGGIGGPAQKRITYDVSPEDAYLILYYQEVRG